MYYNININNYYKTFFIFNNNDNDMFIMIYETVDF